MTDANTSFSPDASTVFAFMKSFNEQQSGVAVPAVEINGPAELDELKHRFLSAAMTMLNTSNAPSPTWLSEPLFSFPNLKSDFNESWDDLAIASRLFPGLANPQTESVLAAPVEFPFLNPFMMLPPGLQSIAAKNFQHINNDNNNNNNKDEDFCELCQKHFCNKYYLRKHKSDVHRIHSEPLAQIRKRETGSGGSDDNDEKPSPVVNSNGWMSVLASSVATSTQPIENPFIKKLPTEAFRMSTSRESNTTNSDDDQMSIWIPRLETKPSRVELGENATFIPPVVPTELVRTSTIGSTPSNRTLNAGTLDMFKSSMAAAKLADRVTCELCKKELCNKYFLRTHKIKVHGLSPHEVGGPTPRSVASKNAEKVNMEDPKLNTDSFNIPPPPPPHLPFVAPILTPQFPAPLGSLPPWVSPHIPPPLPEVAKPLMEDFKRDPVSNLMSANVLVACPLCDKTIVPRLFLPTHLTSIHGLSPTDPSFFIFILSARPLENNAESETAVGKMMPDGVPDRQSPPSSTLQFPNAPFMGLPPSTSIEGVSSDSAIIPQFSVSHTVNGILAPPLPGDLTIRGGCSSFELPTITTTTTSTTTTPANPVLLPPPLGLLSSPAGLYPTPSMPPSQPPCGVVVSTTKWNPVHLAASGLVTKGVLSGGGGGGVGVGVGGGVCSGTANPPRKSPNQMRVLCDICNKWICNKYFLRTHKANKHGITDQAPSSASPSGFGGHRGGTSVSLPLDFSKPGKQQQQHTPEGTMEYYPMGREDAQIFHPTITTPWSSFTNPNPHSPLSRSSESPNHVNRSVDLAEISETFGDRGCPLNLSLKAPTNWEPGVEIKHGVEQFLSNHSDSSTHPTHQRILKAQQRRFQKLRLQRRVARLLRRAHKCLRSLRQGVHASQASLMPLVPVPNEVRTNECEAEGISKSWRNVCYTCNSWFNKRSQLEAHLYISGHKKVTLAEFASPTHDPATTLGVSWLLPGDSGPLSSSAHTSSIDCSLDETCSWWSHQEKRPIDFALTTHNHHHHHQHQHHQTPIRTTTGNPADQCCSYQANHHIIRHSIFGETATTHTI